MALLGEQGAAGFRALFDGFPELVGILWALRDRGRADSRLQLRLRQPGDDPRLPGASGDAPIATRCSRRSPGCATAAPSTPTCAPATRASPGSQEITYDTPFGDGYILGTFAHRVTKLGDGVMVFMTDVTSQRRMEGELRTYADVVAHDLREPVANMALLVRTLELSAEQPPRPEVLEMLRQGIGRSQELIEAILDYARLGELRPERVALGDLMREVADDLRPNLNDARATLVVGELPEVDCDPRQLRRVLQNLVGNAVKFRGEAPPRVEVSALRDRAEWVLTVSDNGIGVDSRQATRIFGMFSRADTRGRRGRASAWRCRGG